MYAFYVFHVFAREDSLLLAFKTYSFVFLPMEKKTPKNNKKRRVKESVACDFY